VVGVEYMVIEDEIGQQVKAKWDLGNVEVPITEENSQSIKLSPNNEKVKKKGNNHGANIELVLQQTIIRLSTKPQWWSLLV